MEASVEKGKIKFTQKDKNGKVDNFVKFGYLKGKAKWAHILKPNEYGAWSVDVYANKIDTDELEGHVQDIIQEARTLVEDLGKQVKGEGDISKEFEGENYFQFKRKQYDSDTKPPKVYNKLGELEADWDKLIGNGSTVKVGYMLSPYYMTSTKTVGVSFKFYAIQVIDLVEYSEGGGNSGFGNEAGDDAPFDTEDADY